MFIRAFAFNTVNVLKFQIVVGCKKRHRTNSTDPDQTVSLLKVFPICYSDNHFVNFSNDNRYFIRGQKKKVFEILEHLPQVKYSYKNDKLLSCQPRVTVTSYFVYNC